MASSLTKRLYKFEESKVSEQTTGTLKNNSAKVKPKTPCKPKKKRFSKKKPKFYGSVLTLSSIEKIDICSSSSDEFEFDCD